MATISPVRLGVIGAGWFASRRHCPDIIAHPEAQLTALCRRDPEALQRMASSFAVEQCYTDYRELVGSGQLDAVIICSPHHLHFQHARAALENDLHVLVEKPITLDPTEGRQLVDLAAQRQKALIVAQNPPYWSHCRFLREELEKGAIGHVEAAHIHWVGNARGVFGLEELPDDLPGVVPPTDFRRDPRLNGGGYLVDGGSHLLCELLWCTGLRVARVSAQMDDASWDIRSVLNLHMDNGAFASLSCAADSAAPVTAKRQHSLYYGSKGTAQLRGFPFSVQIADLQNKVAERTEAELPAAPKAVDNLVDCILGRDRPPLEGETAVHIVEIINAAYASASTGTAVDIAPPPG